MPILIQLLLVVVIVGTTFLVSVAGIQVLHLLSELRLTLKRLNKILENTQALSETSAKPVIAMNQFFQGVKSLVNTTETDLIKDLPDRVISPTHQLSQTSVNSTPQVQPVVHQVHHHQVPASSPDRARRFFRRSGQQLRP